MTELHHTQAFSGLVGISDYSMTARHDRSVGKPFEHEPGVYHHVAVRRNGIDPRVIDQNL